MPPGKQRTPFRQSHVIEFGLKITERDLINQAVLSVRCQFCIFHDREELHPEKIRKRQKTTTVKSWQGNFRPDLYQKHHVQQHCRTWAMYQLLSYDEKVDFFESKTPFNATIPHLFDNKELNLVYSINVSIVDIIIREMFFNSEEDGGTAQTRALKLFSENVIDGNYDVVITNQMQFRLCIGQIAQGNSFRQVVGSLLSVKAIAGLSRIGNLTNAIVANYARVLCAINFQRLATIFRNNNSIWAFSLANDASTHWASSYLDNRVRIHIAGKIYDLHAIAIPMFERHTGENMYLLIVQFLNIICPSWRQKLLGIAADGASVMTGEFQGVVTRLEQQTPHKVYRIWCGLHQLDLVMKHGFKGLMNGKL